MNQIALSVADLRRSHQWYRDVFGLLCAGGTEMFRGWLTAKVQGVPGAATTCWWLIDRQDCFQIELFQFHSPQTRPMPADRTPADIGYSMIGIHVEDFDAVLERAADCGSPVLAAPLGAPGQRRACVRDPDGVTVEILEDDPRDAVPRSRPRPQVPAAVRFVTASVPDLDASRRFFADGLGLREASGLRLHGPEHEALWGLAGAERKTLLLWADDMLLELVQYTRPAGRPRRAGYSISDHGLLNIAFGFRTRRALNRALAAARSAGASPNWHVLELGAWGVVYVNDAQGFSVELLYVRPWWDRRMGFLPAAPDCVVERELRIAAPAAAVWSRLVDHQRMAEWWPCRGARLLRHGADRDGPGAVREISDRLQTLVEEVVAWEPGRRLDYRLLRGAPLRNHFGRVRLQTLADGSTALHYEIRFTPAIPGTGWLLRRVIGGMLDTGLARLRGLCENSGGPGR